MMRFSRKTFFLLAFLPFASFAEECPSPWIDFPAVISAEGRFINRENVRVHVDLIWQHLPDAADTFDITISGRESFRYISSADYRYMEYFPGRIPRQMAMHHLRETIGKSPLRWDDLELLAQGIFLCRDSLHQDSAFVYPARSQTWFRIRFNHPKPDTVWMFGSGEERRLTVHSWNLYDGIFMPTIIDLKGNGESGSFWIRTARRLSPPAPKKAEVSETPQSASRWASPIWNGLNRKSKIALILQMQ